MKKMIMALLALGVISTAHAEVYKITKFTKSQAKQLDAELEPGYCAFPTNKGTLILECDSPAVSVLIKAKAGECYKVSGEIPNERAKKMKCPVKKGNKK